LLEGITQNIPLDTLQQFVPDIFKILFTRLNTGKTFKFIKSFLVFLSIFIVKYSASYVFKIINDIQKGLFLMVIDSLWIPNVLKIDSLVQRKICSIGLIKLLTECPQLFESHVDKWIALLDLLIKLFEERPEKQKEIEEDSFYFSEEGFEVTILTNSNLVYATKSLDPFSEISDPKRFFIDSLLKFSHSFPRKVVPTLQNTVPLTQQRILEYFQIYQIPYTNL